MTKLLRESQHPELVSLDAAASQLGVSAKTLRRLVDKGAVPSYRFGTAIRVSVAEVLHATKREYTTCQSTNEAKRTTSTSHSLTVSDYDALLKHLIEKQRNNCMTS